MTAATAIALLSSTSQGVKLDQEEIVGHDVDDLAQTSTESEFVGGLMKAAGGLMGGAAGGGDGGGAPPPPPPKAGGGGTGPINVIDNSRGAMGGGQGAGGPPGYGYYGGGMPGYPMMPPVMMVDKDGNPINPQTTLKGKSTMALVQKIIMME